MEDKSTESGSNQFAILDYSGYHDTPCLTVTRRGSRI